MTASGYFRSCQAGVFTFTPRKLPPALPLNALTSKIEATRAEFESLRAAAGAGRLTRAPSAQFRINPDEYFADPKVYADSRKQRISMTPAQAAAASRAVAQVDLRSEPFIPAIARIHRITCEYSSRPTPSPGLLRGVQVWLPGDMAIKDAEYIPPPVADIPRCLMELGDYCADALRRPQDRLVDTILIAYQMNAIHPFRDGNGRTFRFIMEILLRDVGLIGRYPLYLEPFMKKYARAWELLFDGVVRRSEWLPFLGFNLDILRETASSIEASFNRSIGARDAAVA